MWVYFIPVGCANIGSLDGAKKAIVHGRHTAMMRAKLPAFRSIAVGVLGFLEGLAEFDGSLKKKAQRGSLNSALWFGTAMGRNASASAKEALAAQLNELSKRTCN
jgi:hypothetical protein